jgi:flagellar hook-basal body complex protein FliE
MTSPTPEPIENLDEYMPKEMPCDVHETMDTCPVKTLKQATLAYITEREQAEHAIGVATGMHRAKTAITVAMNTGSTTMHELRAVIDKEIEAWKRINSLDTSLSTQEDK